MEEKGIDREDRKGDRLRGLKGGEEIKREREIFNKYSIISVLDYLHI